MTSLQHNSDETNGAKQDNNKNKVESENESSYSYDIDEDSESTPQATNVKMTDNFSNRYKHGGSLKNVISQRDGFGFNVNAIIQSVSHQKSMDFMGATDNQAIFTAPIKLMIQKSEKLLCDETHASDENKENKENNKQSQLICIKKQIKHRILLVLQRSYVESHEEGVISIDAFITLSKAISAALDDDDCNELSLLITKCSKLNKFITYSYSICRNSLTQYAIFKELSLAIEVGMVFTATFEELQSKIECIPAIAKYEMLVEILDDIRAKVNEIKQELLGYMELYPEIYSAIQTRHAVQTIIHSESGVIDDLFRRGLLDEIEYHKMIHYLQETQHKLYFQSFYDVTKLNSTTADKKQTLLSTIFMTKLGKTNPKTYNDKIASLMQSLPTTQFIPKNKEITKKNKLATNTSKLIGANNGIYILVSGTAALIIDDEIDSDKIMHHHNNIYLTKGAIIGGYAYLSQKAYLNTVIAKTQCEVYFLSSKILQNLLENEPIATQFLWKQIAVYIILAQFHRNNRSFFAFYDETDINKMCQGSSFIEFSNEHLIKNKLTIPNSMALLLDGTATINIHKREKKEKKEFHSPDILLPADRYIMSFKSKVLRFDYDPKNKNKSISRILLQQRTRRNITF